MTIGTMKNAKAALDGMADYLDSGSSRTCYLIDNVVYKVERYGDESNRSEIRCASIIEERITESFYPFRVPEVTGWQVTEDDFVVAMEYVKGRPIRPWRGDFPTDARRWLESRLGYDCGGENVIIANGWYWLIDLDAYPSD